MHLHQLFIVTSVCLPGSLFVCSRQFQKTDISLFPPLPTGRGPSDLGNPMTFSTALLHQNMFFIS